MLFITGDNAHSREFSEEAYRLAAEPKELFIVPGAGHVDLYDGVLLTRSSRVLLHGPARRNGAGLDVPDGVAPPPTARHLRS
jgi:fermentation-respiration switch protein FrsA (DUF1100 family)